jgi:hypothetical protein
MAFFGVYVKSLFDTNRLSAVPLVLNEMKKLEIQMTPRFLTTLMHYYAKHNQKTLIYGEYLD